MFVNEPEEEEEKTCFFVVPRCRDSVSLRTDRDLELNSWLVIEEAESQSVN
jgi:hypothetical protein